MNKQQRKYIIHSSLTIEQGYAALKLMISGERFDLESMPDMIWNFPITFRWGSFRLSDQSWKDWNFGGWTISGRSIYDYKEIARLADAALKRIEGAFEPMTVISRLMGSRMFVEALYDYRLGCYVLRRDLANPGWKLYNALSQGDDQDILASALASDEEQARKAISVHLINSDPSALQQWASNQFKMNDQPRGSIQDKYWSLTFLEKAHLIQPNHNPDIKQEKEANNV